MTANFSRRALLKCAAAGTAAALPAVAQLSDEEQLEACVATLRELLSRMHPGATNIHPHSYQSRVDGSFRLTVQGDVKFQPWQGDGIYLVSISGCPHEYLVREERVIGPNGRDMGYGHFYGRARAEDGGWDHFEQFLPPNFVRKLEEKTG